MSKVHPSPKQVQARGEENEEPRSLKIGMSCMSCLHCPTAGSCYAVKEWAPVSTGLTAQTASKSELKGFLSCCEQASTITIAEETTAKSVFDLHRQSVMWWVLSDPFELDIVKGRMAHAKARVELCQSCCGLSGLGRLANHTHSNHLQLAQARQQLNLPL